MHCRWHGSLLPSPIGGGSKERPKAGAGQAPGRGGFRIPLPQAESSGQERAGGRGVCTQGALGYGKVINPDVRHPPPPTSGRLQRRWPAPCLSLRYCVPLGPPTLRGRHGGGRILIRWLATVPSRRPACSTVKGYLPVLCVRPCAAAARAADPSPARRRDGLDPAWEHSIIRIITVVPWHCL